MVPIFAEFLTKYGSITTSSPITLKKDKNRKSRGAVKYQASLKLLKLWKNGQS